MLVVYLGYIVWMFGLVYGGESCDYVKIVDCIVVLEIKFVDVYWDVVKCCDVDFGYNLCMFV